MFLRNVYKYISFLCYNEDGDTMKKFLLAMLNIILSIIIFLLLFSFCGKIVFSGFITDFLGSINSGIKNQEFTVEEKEDNKDKKIDVERNYTIEELLNSPEYKELLKNKEVQKLVDKYINITINGVIDEKNLEEADLKEDIIKFLKENKEVLEKEYGISISYEDIDELENSDEFSSITDDYIDSVKTVRQDITDGQKKLIKMYNVLCSLAFKIILFILLIVNLVCIAILQKSLYKWVQTLGANLIFSGALTIILGIVLHFGINAIVSKMKLGLKFGFLKVSVIGLIACVVGIVLIVVYTIIKKKTDKDNLEDLYYEVSHGDD